MPAELGWLVEERILYSRSWGDIDIFLVKRHADCVLEYLNSGYSTPVHFIIDSLDIDSFDVELQKLNLQSRRYLTHRRLVTSIDVTHNIKNQVLGHVVSGVAKVNWTNVRQLEDALDYIMLMDDHLQDLDLSLFESFVPKKIVE